ncbi:hypothetical protein [Dyadobacter sp. 22481]|uniref:hypothetical protein n=1 Tax=Dyadobacter sp. 22481 TaxID=3453926 RepID=UPI003F86B1DD
MRFISEGADLRPLWMSPEEVSDPSKLISHFCKTHSIADCRFLLWQMLSNSISTGTPHIHASAGEQLYFFENLMPFLEAVFLMQHETKLTHDESSETEAIGGNSNKARVEENHQTGASGELFQAIGSKRGKFKRKQKHIRNHSIWYRQRIIDPFRVIADFFDAYSLMSFKANLYDVLQAVSADHFYQKGSPSDVLYIFERLESVINAAYLINNGGIQAKFIKPGDLIERVKIRQEINSSWEMLPSLLNSEEMTNPQKVLTSFFDYKSLRDWKQELTEVYNFALSKHPACEWGVCIDSLSVFVYSVKLVEALYLFHSEHI